MAVNGVRRAFISYAHESDDHIELVRSLWLALRSNGIDAKLDRPAAANRQDWSLWMADQIRDADFILVVASQAYRRRAQGQASADDGRGVQWEARLIRDAFYAQQDQLNRFVPVVLPGHTVADIPDFLAPATTTTYYVADFSPSGLEPLLRLLFDQPEEVEPPLGQVPHLPPRDHNPTSSMRPRNDDSHRVSNTVSGSVTGTVVQAGVIHGDVHVFDTPPRRTEELPDLAVSVVSLHSMSKGWFHAFRREDARVAKSFAAELELPRDQAGMDALFDRRLRAGAYALAHPMIPACAVLSLFNPSGTHEAVVQDVLVTDKTDGPVVDGTAFLIEAGASNDDPITFRLDSPFPLATLLEDGIDKGRYFASRHIRVAPGEHVMLPLKFDAERSSHTFKLTFVYQFRGQRATTMVDYYGQPFRISPTAHPQVSTGYEKAYTMIRDDNGSPRLIELATADFPHWLK